MTPAVSIKLLPDSTYVSSTAKLSCLLISEPNEPVPRHIREGMISLLKMDCAMILSL